MCPEIFKIIKLLKIRIILLTQLEMCLKQFNEGYLPKHIAHWLVFCGMFDYWDKANVVGWLNVEGGLFWDKGEGTCDLRKGTQRTDHEGPFKSS